MHFCFSIIVVVAILTYGPFSLGVCPPLPPVLRACVLFIPVVEAIFDIGTIFITRPPPSLISALFFVVCVHLVFLSK